MKRKKLKIGTLSNIILLIFVSLMTNSYVLAQNGKDEIPAPADEEFREAEGVIRKPMGMPGRTADEFTGMEIYRIYNADKTIWYEFSWDEKSPIYMFKNKKADFKPFDPFVLYGLNIRVIAQSENWYKVVVNEETKETKYTLKSDPNLVYVSFWYIFDGDGDGYGFVRFDCEKNPLRETPNGKPIEHTCTSERAVVKKMEGEWLYVEMYYNRSVKGWIRGRIEGKVLVGYGLNGSEIPEQ